MIDWDGLMADAQEHDAKLYMQIMCPDCLGGPGECDHVYACAKCLNTGRVASWVPLTSVITTIKEVIGE